MKNKIKKMLKNDNITELEASILNDALKLYPDNPEDFFTDLQANGCQSGMIPSLITYNQTAGFFDMYYDNINDTIEQYQYETYETVKINGDIKNCLAWFAYEYAAENLYIKLTS